MDVENVAVGDNAGNNNVMNFVKDISSGTASKQKFVDNLKFDYEKVQVEVKMKMDELDKIKESNSQLQHYLNSHKFMLDELQGLEEGDVEEIKCNQETVSKLRDEMSKLRMIRNDDLNYYEEKVANITNHFVNGPFTVNQDLLSDKRQKLLDIQADVRKELLSIQADVEAIKKKFHLDSPHGPSKPITQLENLKAITEEENLRLASETEKLENELRSLSKVSSGLQEEINLLKQQHRVD